MAVGADETAPFLEQAEGFCRNGPDWRLAVMPGLNHMTILSEMGEPGTAMARLLAETIHGRGAG